jgi:integrase
MKLTTTAIRELTLPEGIADKTYFCESLPGFGLRIRAGGAKTYVVTYKTAGRNKRVVLGTPAVLTAEKARATARDILAKVRLGGDPAAERQEKRDAERVTFGSLLPRYLEQQIGRMRPRSLEAATSYLTDHLKAFRNIPVTNLDRRTIAIRLAEIAETNGPAAANRCRGCLVAFLNWVVREGILDANPAANTNKATENGPRTRLLADAELAEIWNAASGAGDYGEIVRLLMLTGARREEIGSLVWSEVDLESALITLPPTRTKNSREHTIPLVPAAVDILRARARDGDIVFGRTFGFKNWSTSKRKLSANLDITDWHLHDFRKVLSTVMHERLNVEPHIVEACLGHAPIGIAAVYNLSAYTDRKRIALDKWAAHLLAVVTGERPSSVVKLRR